jgi:preprotein translocase subunit SecF
MASSTTKKVIIWIIVGLFLITTGLTFVLYLTAPTQIPVDENVPTDIEEYVNLEQNVNIVTPQEEVNVDTPEENDIQVVVTENENQNEMTQTVEVPLENGEVDTPTVGDFSDSLQLSQ